MRRLIVYSLFLLINVTFLSGQEISVLEEEQLTTTAQGVFYFPQFGPPGDKIFFTSSNYVGLYYYETQSRSIVKLNDDPGAGYEPVFSPDGATLFYRSFLYKNRRKYSSIYKQQIVSQQKAVIVKERRNISTPKINNSGGLLFLENTQVQRIDLGVDKITEHRVQPERTVFIENTKIILVTDGVKEILAPLGEGHYIWPAISPDGTRLLFTKLGDGTFVTNIDGSNPISLGMANAPKWSPDGQWITYMVDKDDGYQVLESDIFAVSADGEQVFQLTDTDDKIEMYPAWGIDNSQIVFATDKGEIYLMQLETK